MSHAAEPFHQPIQPAIDMKTPALLLALLLGGATALRAQPTNREYNRLQEATNRAYSVPDRPAPRSAPAERSYTPSSSSGPNTPYSGGMQVVVPGDGTGLFGGNRAAERQRALDWDKNMQAKEAAEQKARQDVRDAVDRETRERETAEAVAEGQNERIRTQTLKPFMVPFEDIGFADYDLLPLAILAEKSQDFRASNQARQARLALKAKLTQPGGDFAELRSLVAQEWGIIEVTGISGGTYQRGFGFVTAIEDYTELQRRFPAQAAELEPDLIRISLALMTSNLYEAAKLHGYFKPFKFGLKELNKHFIRDKGLVVKMVAPSLHQLIPQMLPLEPDDTYLEKISKEDVVTGFQMLYAASQQELLQYPNDQKLADALATSAGRLLELLPEASLANRVEWLILGLEKKHDALNLPAYLLETPEFLVALTDAQAQQVSTTLGINLGDQSTRARLARMLPPTKVLPDNPDWQALKAGEPLAETIRQLATKYKGNVGELLLGTLTACTKPGQDGQNEAMAYWDKAKDDGWNKDNGTRTIVAMRTAARNMYRAVTLDQGGDYKTVYRVKGKDDADDLLFYKKLSYSPTARELVSKSWGEQQLLFKAAEEVKSYQDALVLLDQSSDFPPIGATMKKKAKVKLQYLAKNGYALAQAKLKEL